MGVVLRLPRFALDDWHAKVAMFAMVNSFDAYDVQVEGIDLPDGMTEVRCTNGQQAQFEEIARDLFPQYVVEMEP